MNLVGKTPRAAACGALWILALLLIPFVGCAPRPSPPEQVAAFNAAGPAPLVVAPDQLINLRTPTVPHRVGVGHVVEVRVRAGGEARTVATTGRISEAMHEPRICLRLRL